ncbi:MAG: hypothetical protein AABY09_00050 [Nanoarchaeota archaeon]
MRLTKALLLISLSGSMFAGYLAYSKIFANVCPFNEPCSHLWGYPTCLYGFVMFFTILILSLIMLRKYSKKLMLASSLISAAGILFATYFTYKDMSGCSLIECDYAMVLPTCAYGLIFFIAALVTSIVALKRKS